MRGFAAFLPGFARFGAILAGVAVVTAPAWGGPEPVKVDVAIDGLDKAMETNVRATLALAVAAREGALPEGEVRRLHGRARGDIARALEPFGYYRPVVTDALEPGAGTWRARYAVDPGPAMLLDSVTVEVRGDGAALPAIQAALAEFPLRPGSRLEHVPYELLKNRLAQAAAASGYLAAEFTSRRIAVDRARGRATIDLRYDTGPRYRFGPVRFEQDVLDVGFLGHYATFEEGDPYEAESLTNLQGLLSSSNYFSRVEVEPRPSDRPDDLVVPVDVALDPARRIGYTIGAGYGTDTGPFGRVGVNFRRLNRSGHRAEITGELGEVKQAVAGQYQVPYAFGGEQLLTLSAGYGREVTDAGFTRGGTVGASLARVQGAWQLTLGLNYARNRFEIGLDAGEPDLLMGEATLSRTKADDRIYTRHGSRILARLRGAHRELLSDVTFGLAALDGKWIRSLGPRGRLLLRGEVGAVGTGDFHALPPTQRYFAGGASSVRAYGYQELGEVDGSGLSIGGTHLLFGSVEYEQRVVGTFGLAAFFDSGNAMLGFDEALATGAGLGVRWHSPVGPIRLDVAHALGSRGEGRDVQVQFAIGPDL